MKNKINLSAITIILIGGLYLSVPVTTLAKANSCKGVWDFACDIVGSPLSEEGTTTICCSVCNSDGSIGTCFSLFE